MALVTKPLDPTTWPDFAQLAEDHHGVWSGCWCLGFHEEGKNGVHSPERRRELKEARVADGRAHAALVYDGSRCVGWCQFGSAGELPRIKFQKAYNAGPSRPPDWRITCFFTGRTHRHQGVADAGLDGALAEITRLGAGRVESYPEDTAGRKVSGSFLNNATLSLFERHGFTRERRLGKHHWLVSRVIGVGDG